MGHRGRRSAPRSRPTLRALICSSELRSRAPIPPDGRPNLLRLVSLQWRRAAPIGLPGVGTVTAILRNGTEGVLA